MSETKAEPTAAEDEPVQEPQTDEQQELDPAQPEGTQQEGEHLENEEFEIVLGSAEKPAAEQIVAKKPKGRVNRLLVERRNLLDAKTVDRDRIAELESRLIEAERANTQPATQVNAVPFPVMPTDEELDYDSSKIAQARAKYHQELYSLSRSSGAQGAQEVYDNQQTSLQIAQQQQKQQSAINAHYDRAEKLNLADYETKEQRATEILGQNVVSDIAKLIPNSEAVLYHLGTDEEKAFEIKGLLSTNPTLATLELGGLSKDLKIVPKQTQRLQPETRITGAAPASKSSLEKEIDAERARINNGETHDLTQLQKLKGQLRNAS